ncbi:unnamed protein product [Effrenium voratum]|nr:unnamed protein product [Effrenium voratum]
MGLSGSHLHADIRDVAPFTTEIVVQNNMQTPVLIIEAKHHGDATPAHGIEHSVPPGEHAIMSGYLKEPRATIFVRTGLHEAKRILVPNLGRVTVSAAPHGLKVETVDTNISIEDYDGDAALIKGNDTVPMLLHNEHFKDSSSWQFVMAIDAKRLTKGLEDATTKSGCWKGLRAYCENDLSGGGKQADARVLNQNYFPHPTMNTLSLQWGKDSHLAECSGKPEDSVWWPHHNAMVYEDWYVHTEQNYADRLEKLNKDFPKIEIYEEGALFVHLAFGAEHPQKELEATMQKHMPNWALVERTPLLDEHEPALLAQDQVNFDCALVMPGNKANRGQHYGTGFCGLVNVHSGYRDYLVSSVQTPGWQKIAQKLPQCRRVICAGHSRGGSVCELFAACVNNGKTLDQDYRRLMWMQAEPRVLMPLQKEAGMGLLLDPLLDLLIRESNFSHLAHFQWPPELNKVDLNRQLAKCQNAKELQQVIHAAGGALSLVNLVTALHRLAHLSPPGARPRKILDLSSELHFKLCQALATSREREQVSIRTWSNTAWAVAKLTLDSQLLPMAADALLKNLGMDSVRPQELANIQWSLAKSGVGTAEQLERCTQHFVQRAEEVGGHRRKAVPSARQFEVQHISNIALPSASDKLILPER